MKRKEVRQPRKEWSHVKIFEHRFDWINDKDKLIYIAGAPDFDEGGWFAPKRRLTVNPGQSVIVEIFAMLSASHYDQHVFFEYGNNVGWAKSVVTGSLRKLL